jgi:hypothetical protein
VSLRNVTPRAPARPPLVIPLVLAIFALQAVCLPALPVLFVAGGLIRWRGWRPGWIALGAFALLVAEAAWVGPDLLVMHFAGWTKFSVQHPFQVIVPRLITEAPVGIPLGIVLGALVLAHGEHTAAGAEWHPATQRRRQRQQATPAAGFGASSPGTARTPPCPSSASWSRTWAFRRGWPAATSSSPSTYAGWDR